MPNPFQLLLVYLNLRILQLAFLLTIKRRSRKSKHTTPHIQSPDADLKPPNGQANFNLLSYDYSTQALPKEQYNLLLEGSARLNHNPKTLLGLRTFGKPDTADFLFHVTKKWTANYGHVACLMDARLAKYEFGMLKFSSDMSEGFYQEVLKSNHFLAFLFTRIVCGILYVSGPIVGAIVALDLEEVNATLHKHLALFYLSVGFVIPWLLSFVVMIWFAQSIFVKSDKSILKVTQSQEFAKKRSPSTRRPFCIYTFYCLPDSWRVCLGMLLKEVDGIVMDLGGIAKENQGCKYEISLLVQRGLLRKTTFIIESESDRQVLLSTLYEAGAKGPVRVANLPRLKTDWSEYQGCPAVLMNKVKIALKYEPGEIFSLLKTIYDGS